jgi:dipeptidyl aminopeptidase/acylaminoacyl peptidase
MLWNGPGAIPGRFVFGGAHQPRKMAIASPHASDRLRLVGQQFRVAGVRGFSGVAVAALVGVATPAMGAPPPASAFGRLPAAEDVAISPNGQRIAILGGLADQRVLSISTIDKPEMPFLRLGDIETISVRWAGDDHVIVRVAYMDSVGPRQNYRFERNISVTAEAKVAARILDNDTDSQFTTYQPILGITSAIPPRAMVQGITFQGNSQVSESRVQVKGQSGVVASLWSVDPATGDGRRVEMGNYDTVFWEVDREGKPRVRLDINDLNGKFVVYGRAGGGGTWKPVWNGGDYESRLTYYGYSEPDDAVYLNLDEGLVKRRLADGVVEPLGSTAAGLSPHLIWDEHRNTAAAIGTGGERPTYEWLEPDIGAAANVLIRAFKGQHVRLMGWSQDQKRFLARVSGPANPSTWYLYDRQKKEVSPVGEAYPELKDVPMGTTRWIIYKAADGLEIPAYFTLPPGAKGGERLPVIVFPHSGPNVRDTYDFDFLAQFMATRGYAVLQPQFRGSWGFGKAHEKAGRGESGGKIQTDMQDGVAALAASGEIDPSRACIVGSGFGGYSALASAALFQGAYKCAVAIAPIADLGLFVTEIAQRGRRDEAIDELRRELGAATKDKLFNQSPVKHASAVQIPILMIHGDQDTAVSLTHSRLMAEELKKAGKPHELIVLKGENHYLAKAATRIQTLEAIEAFLAKNLPVN